MIAAIVQVYSEEQTRCSLCLWLSSLFRHGSWFLKFSTGGSYGESAATMYIWRKSQKGFAIPGTVRICGCGQHCLADEKRRLIARTLDILFVARRSFYNALDLAAFLIPMAASINQLINISQNNLNGATRDLSFSIIIIFLHLVKSHSHIVRIKMTKRYFLLTINFPLSSCVFVDRCRSFVSSSPCANT